MKLHDRLRDVLARLVVADPAGAVVDYSRARVSVGAGGHGKHGTTSAPPPRVSSLAHEWAAFFARALDMAELDLALAQGRAQLAPRRVGSGGRVASGVAAARRRRIVQSDVYRGRPDAFVAYVEGCSEALVRKARDAADLDSHGLRKQRPLTASRPSRTTTTTEST